MRDIVRRQLSASSRAAMPPRPAAAAAAEAVAPAQPAASLDCLPDHLLGRIMALAGRMHG